MDLQQSAHTRSFRPDEETFGWDDVEVLAYKDEGTAPFRSITRQVLFEEAEHGCQLRYFEVAPGGYSTLERHEHVHAVLILRGRGTCLIGDEVREIGEHDLCLVPSERDRPQLPTEADLQTLRANPTIAEFLG